MKKNILLLSLLTLFLFACGTEEQPTLEEFQEPQKLEEIWICHNPNSPAHNDFCSEECFEPGNSGAYCWLLLEEDCKINLRFEWQRECCPLFEEE